jgi:hypothetical protein
MNALRTLCLWQLSDDIEMREKTKAAAAVAWLSLSLSLGKVKKRYKSGANVRKKN